MVHIALHSPADPFKMSMLIVLPLGKSTFAVAHSMRLDIRLCHYIKAITVAECVPERIVRIMTGTYSIDVQLFHDLDILDHIGFSHHISLVWIHLMTVGTLDKHRLAVHKELSILDAHIPESDFKRCTLGLSLLVE